MTRVNLVSQSDYAKHRGCSAVAVHKAIKAGRISLIDGKIDPAVADVQWAQNTRARASNAPQNVAAPIVGQRTASAAAAGADGAADGDADYWQSRARREAAEAEIARLKLAEMRGTLIEQRQAVIAVSAAFQQLRDTLHPIGRRLAPTVATMDNPREIELAYQRALQETLDYFAAHVVPALLAGLGGTGQPEPEAAE